ncbi:hypothetical protein [Yersinia intermedia]|uniref:hypothetical protein n=1 Tax=Yersinia intermedia TaxID=631 RepID=UPI0005E5684F|nr:hypothetical protein [Yersinia intermedia]CNH41428.1 Uncharacterised protein [Yersinia intermedia]
MISANPYHYYRLHRHDGQLLYLKAIALGVGCVICALLLDALLKLFFFENRLIEIVSEKIKISGDINKDKIYLWFVFISFLTLVLAFFWVFIIFIKNTILGGYYSKKYKTNFFGARKLRVLKETFNEGSFDALLFNAMERKDKRSVLINLDSGKVYVGLINAIGEPTENEGPNSDISILPIMSGYRNKDTQQIKFTNIYSGVSNKNHSMSVIIDANEVTHISWFDMDEYQKTNDTAPSYKKTEPTSPPIKQAESKNASLFCRFFGK